MTDPTRIHAFLDACRGGDLAAMRDMLDREPGLARAAGPGATTGLHAAVRHPDAVRLLLGHGADPSARDEGDNALPLHWAAAYGDLESVRALLDAGSDVHGKGDLHTMDAIGWATCFAEPRRDVVELLLSRGARHHVFSAIACGDREGLRALAAADATALHRRLSEHEQHQSALHYVVAPADGLVGGTFRTGDHYRTLDLLIELGADLEATDRRGRTPMMVAMLRGDREAMRILQAAGARLPDEEPGPPAERAPSVTGVTPMLAVRDVDATVAWYVALGFELQGSNANDGRMDWASLALDGQEVMFVPAGEAWREASRGVSLWFRTDRLDDLYVRYRALAMAHARAVLEGREPDGPEVRFRGDLHTAFYGQREFSISDPDGVDLNFAQPLD